MTFSLDIIEEEHKKQNGPPPDAIWHCCECDWKGLIQDCPTEREPIGFIDGPWYDMPICPDCGCGVDI